VQLLKNFPEGSLPCSQEPPSGVPILRQINPVHTTPSYLRSILKLSTHLHLGGEEIVGEKKVEGKGHKAKEGNVIE
jgi:hypothetical protein